MTRWFRCRNSRWALLSIWGLMASGTLRAHHGPEDNAGEATLPVEMERVSPPIPAASLLPSESQAGEGVTLSTTVASSTDTPYALPAPDAGEVRDAVGPAPAPAEQLPARPSQGRRIVPFVSASALWGRSPRPQGEATMTGSAGLLSALSIPLNANWRVVTQYQAGYQFTRQVLAVGDQPILFQHRMNHRLAAKLVYGPEGSRHRLKAGAGWRAEFLKETRDEPWGKGLFDYRKPSIGFEWEYLYGRNASLRAGLDFYKVNFPNYSTLESQGALLVNGRPTARELAGGRALDSSNISLLLGAAGPLKISNGPWDLSYTLTLQKFPAQPIVNPQGQLDPALRRDATHSLRLSAGGAWKPRLVRKITGALETSTSWTSSNQNNFDALQGLFFADYHSHRELSLGPSLTLHFGHPRGISKPVRWSLSLGWSRQTFPHRPVQDSLGRYQGDAIRILNTSWSTSLSWPLTPHINLIGSFRKDDAVSNMRYERFYRYNFSNKLYLFGLGYEL